MTAFGLSLEGSPELVNSERVMMSRYRVFVTAMLLFSISTQAGYVVTYSSQGKSYFSVQSPDSWQVNMGSDTDPAQMPEGEIPPPRVMTLVPDDDSTLWFGVWVPVYLHSLDEAQDYLSSLDDFLVDSPVLKKSDEVNLNTMKARYFAGEGTKQGNPADFFVMLFELSKQSVGIAIYIGAPETTERHREILRGIMKSITPVGA